MHAAEENGIFHPTLDDAAVGDHGIHRRAGTDVFCRDFILDLGIDGVLGVEHIASDRAVKQGHIMLIEGIDRIEPCDVAIVPPAVDAAFIDIFHEHIAHEIAVAMRGSLLDEVFEPFLFHYVCIAAAIRGGRKIRVYRKICNPAVSIHGEPQIVKLLAAVKAMLHAVHYGDLRARFDVLTDHIIIGGIINGMAACHNNVLLARTAHIAEHGADGVDSASVHAGIILGNERRKDEKAVTLSVQIPFLAAAEMIHERMIISLCNQADIRNPRIHQIREQEVDCAVSAAEGNGSDRAREGQFAEHRICFACIDKTECIICHELTSSPSFLRLRPCPWVRVRRFRLPRCPI